VGAKNKVGSISSKGKGIKKGEESTAPGNPGEKIPIGNARGVAARCGKLRTNGASWWGFGKLTEQRESVELGGGRVYRAVSEGGREGKPILGGQISVSFKTRSGNGTSGRVVKCKLCE